MNINAIIAPKCPADIVKIYHGLDHYCRCGCGGKYFTPGTAGFTRAMHALEQLEPLKPGASMYPRDGRGRVECEGIDRGVDKGYNYINIPVDGENDKCYCLYF